MMVEGDDLYLRAYAMVVSSARQAPEALRLIEQAIARDPGCGPAPSPGPHSAVFDCFRTSGAKIARQTAGRASISLGEPSK